MYSDICFLPITDKAYYAAEICDVLGKPKERYVALSENIRDSVRKNYLGEDSFADNNLVLSARTDLGRNASLCYVKLVKSNGKSKEINKKIIYHFDCDYYTEEKYKNVSETVKRIKML